MPQSSRNSQEELRTWFRWPKPYLFEIRHFCNPLLRPRCITAWFINALWNGSQLAHREEVCSERTTMNTASAVEATEEAQALALGFGLGFGDLYSRDGLVRLDQAFLRQLLAGDAGLYDRLTVARANETALDRLQSSQLILDLAPHLENFIGRLFDIADELNALEAQHSSHAALLSLKKKFVQRRGASGLTPEAASAIDGPALAAQLELLFGETLTEDSYTRHVSRWLEENKARAEELKIAAQYAGWAAVAPEGRRKHRGDILFKLPQMIDPYRLIETDLVQIGGIQAHAFLPEKWRHREGFELTDHGASLRSALDQSAYCVKCHLRGRDSCSSGMKSENGRFEKSTFGVALAGCPLEEKISEMNMLKGRGLAVAALGTIVIDNPLCAGTGHRICNDCVKACVLQVQDPVDIPQIETRALKDVLALPYGFEIYSLLTRWNPLNFRRPLPEVATGYKVLVVGLGPAGYSLAHHLMNEGHSVTAVDGLKIEPLDSSISGIDLWGERVPFRPIRDVSKLYEPLSERITGGFGGVAEYGITVRWDKNFLKLIRLLLERRREFVMFGGVRFGGTLTVEQAFSIGFDHIALCMGAGKPTVVPMKNGLARGVRQASDFLMALQLTGAAKEESLANLQIRMPVVVIGGGLTAIDAATESMAYYLVQIEKFLSRYEALCAERSEPAVRSAWLAAEAEIADEFIAHARTIRRERALAAEQDRPPDLTGWLLEWGGATVAYRRRLIDAPSYTLNHEEVSKAMEEGVRFAECLAPEAVHLDAHGAAHEIQFGLQAWDESAGRLRATGESVTLPACTILIAAGTHPNTVLAREDPSVVLDEKHFQAVDEDGKSVSPERLSKPEASHVLMDIRPDGCALSFFGDLHPSFSGNVVKAMASAKQGYPVVSRILARRPASGPTPEQLRARLNHCLRPRVHSIGRLAENIVEVVIEAPRAVRSFQPGQFYRLQNYESLARKVEGTSLAMEGLALTGAQTDPERGLISLIVLEMGGSSDICATLQPGEPVILMGPTGAPTETPGGETVLLAGGGLGNAVLFSIGTALRAQGSKVVYFAGYKRAADRYKVEEIERAADVIVWTCDVGPGFKPGRPQDRSFVGNIVAAMEAYATGKLGYAHIPLNECDRIVAIGSDGMMNAVAQARNGLLAAHLKPGHCAIGSINSPMQCMMKEICGQCLQEHKDPISGADTVVFSCFNQDQSLDRVDFSGLRSRLRQNSVHEKLTKQWIDRSLRLAGLRGQNLA
jgi:NADPH-dependent glutamate synthase beta subunit-like oxidoreductase/NAD(P)H-flavin reductase